MYVNSLRAAREYIGKTKVELKSIAFPSISTGIFGYPLKEAAQIALGEVIEEIEKGNFAFSEVRFVLWPDTYPEYAKVLESFKKKSKG